MTPAETIWDLGVAGGPVRDEGDLGPGARILRGWCRERAEAVLAAVGAVAAAAPFRHMATPGGHRMSIAMTSCGELGWVSDADGYRYTANDPLSGARWPALPEALLQAADGAAAAAGFPGFRPDACLVNRYAPGARLTMHQDRNERDLSWPVVSLSFGLPAVFLFGGVERSQKPRRILLEHGDAVVWGGPARLNHHGVLPLMAGNHPLTGGCRVNLTFRVVR